MLACSRRGRVEICMSQLYGCGTQLPYAATDATPTSPPNFVDYVTQAPDASGTKAPDPSMTPTPTPTPTLPSGSRHGCP